MLTYIEKDVANKMYILSLSGLVANYPYTHTVRKGGIIGIYTNIDNAKERMQDIIQNFDNTLTEEDFAIGVIENGLISIN